MKQIESIIFPDLWQSVFHLFYLKKEEEQRYLNSQDHASWSPCYTGLGSIFRARKEAVSTGQVLILLPMSFGHLCTCYWLYMNNNNSQPNLQPGAQRWSGRLCCYSWSPRSYQGSLTAENLHYKSGVWGMCLGSVGIRKHNFNPQCYCCFQHKRWWWSIPEPWTLKEAESGRLGPGTRKERTDSGEFSAGAQISLRGRQMISPDVPMVRSLKVSPVPWVRRASQSRVQTMMKMSQEHCHLRPQPWAWLP